MTWIYRQTSNHVQREATRRAALAEWASQDQSAVESRIIDINRRHPHLSGQVAVALAEAGHGADSQVVEQAAALQVKRDADRPWWDRLSGGNPHLRRSMERAKDASRATFATLSLPVEMLGAGIRVGAEATEKTFTEGYGPANRYLQDQGSLGDLFNQTTYGAALQLNDETGVAAWDLLNRTGAAPATSGEAVDTGGGSWFPGYLEGSPAGRRQVRNAVRAGTTGGFATTPGRLLAAGGVGLYNSALELHPDQAHARRVRAQPGGVVWDLISGPVDLAWTLAADPVGKGGRAGRAAALAKTRFSGATRTLEEPDLVEMTARRSRQVTDSRGMTRTVEDDIPILVDNGTRKTVLFENAYQWITNSRAGNAFAEYAAREQNFERLRRATGRRVPVPVLLALREAQDPVEVKRIMVEALGDSLVDGPLAPKAADFAAVGMNPLAGSAVSTVPLFGKVAGLASAKFVRPTTRYRQLLPSDTGIRLADPTWSVEQYDRVQRFVRQGALKPVLTDDQISRNNEELARALVAGDVVQVEAAHGRVIEAALVGNGVDEETASAAVRLFGDHSQSMRHYWVDAAGQDVKHQFAVLDGNGAPIGGLAHAYSEMVTDFVPFMDFQQVKDLASRYQRLVTSRGYQNVVGLADGSNMLFKGLVLGARGPAWALRNVAESQGRIAVHGDYESIFTDPVASLAWLAGHNKDGKLARLIGRLNRDGIRGAEDLADRTFDASEELLEHTTKFQRAMEDGSGPWGDLASQAGNIKTGLWQPIHRQHPDWLEAHRRQLAALSGNVEYNQVAKHGPTLAVKDAFWADQYGRRARMARRNPQLATREGADRYIDEVQARIVDATGGDTDLIEAIATGRIKGVPLVERTPGGVARANKAAYPKLREMRDRLPDWTAGDVSIRKPRDPWDRPGQAGRAVFEGVMGFFGTRADNYFVRSFTFRQAYWNAVERLAPLGDTASKTRIVAQARKTNQSTKRVKTLERGTADGNLTWEDINSLAHQRALDETLDLIYDSHDKGNWTQTLRLIQPFAAAVQDMYKVWGRLLKRHPLVLHTVDQGLRGGHANGFFFFDEQTGEERFAYPLSGALSQLAGLPDGVPMSGSIKGANMVTTGLIPSFGPAATLPAGALLPDREEFDWLRDFLMPYGSPADEGGGLADTLTPLPTWVKRAGAAFGVATPANKAAYEAHVADTLGYLATTGKYDLKSEKGWERLFSDARSKARALYLIRALAQSSAPAAPKHDWLARDKSGRLLVAAKMAKDYRRMLAEDPDTAGVEMYKKYGSGVFYVIAGNTVGSASPTQAAHNLVREHPQVESRYPDVWDLFTDPHSPYSPREQRRQVGADTRRGLKVEEIAARAQGNVAWAIYREYRDQFGPYPTDPEQDYLRTVKDALRKEFPLWRPDDVDFNRTNRSVEQVQKAVTDPALADLPAAVGAKLYLEYRAQAQAAAEDADLASFGKAKKAAPLRAWLRQVGAVVVEQHPDFEPLWEQVFSRELLDDGDE